MYKLISYYYDDSAPNYLPLNSLPESTKGRRQQAAGSAVHLDNDDTTLSHWYVRDALYDYS
jgi:hypothetical protein